MLNGLVTYHQRRLPGLPTLSVSGRVLQHDNGSRDAFALRWRHTSNPLSLGSMTSTIRYVRITVEVRRCRSPSRATQT